MKNHFTFSRSVLCLSLVMAGLTGCQSKPDIPNSMTAPKAASQSEDSGTTPVQTAKVTVESQTQANGLRQYQFTTSATLRDDLAPNRAIVEQPGAAYVRSGNELFDGLFALAQIEMQLDAVDEIQDGAYNHGEAIACECFETGEKWHYVWTRDLSYAANLGLALLEPQRVVNSLLFKTSGFRQQINISDVVAGDKSGWQIIQDTGSGGSWPISTDRVTWAFGAEAALNNLHGDDYQTFAQTALIILSNTIENDRKIAFDVKSGLYMGEQSFLDWREQTYASWLPQQLTSMATSKALSTNVAHYKAITLAARLASEQGEPQQAAKYQQWAANLKQAINQQLWLPEQGLYSSLTAGQFDNNVLQKYDWLGQSLAVITGVASAAQTKAIMANYPHGPQGAPVIFPQQPGIAVYHNRAIWPFVTAYGLKAARSANNQAVAVEAYQTLIQSAAANLSNMENLEWLSGKAWYQDPNNADLSGPVINSRRQLWSVGAYLSMVINDLFGINAVENGLQIAPYIPAKLYQQYFAAQSSLQLKQLNWQGHELNITLNINDKTAQSGVFAVDSIELNKQTLNGLQISIEQLKDKNQLVINLGNAQAADTDITRVSAEPDATPNNLFVPFEPQLALSDDKQTITIVDTRNQPGSVSYQLMRNGKPLAELPAATGYRDTDLTPVQRCYSAMAVFNDSGLQSHHSKVHCTNDGSFIRMDSAKVQINQPVSASDNGPYIKNWGAADDVLNYQQLKINQSGDYALQFKYANHHHAINTGITAGVKWLQLFDNQQQLVAEGVVVMPHISQDIGWSTPLKVKLKAGDYQAKLLDYYNMSYLQNNQTYSEAGGLTGPLNTVDLYGLRIMPLAAE
ncbi:esterase [Neptunicella marina]|uniref:Esterase n=1 Tax=Neptunicella marina TaxID=2125989 RepID=A0A8J6LYS2_9ALTE|nr:esterase [Neptunicella marina]MBC3765590.1 esterase [Neptunicella marina]